MIESATRADLDELPREPAYRKLQRIVFAACMFLGPLIVAVGIAIAPSIGGSGGRAVIAAVTRLPDRAQLEATLSVPGLILLPLAFLGLARLAMRRSPWLATLGGGLALVGWATWPAFVIQDTMTNLMAQMGGGAQFATLWERLNSSPVYNGILLVYIVGHVMGTLLLGLALGRARVIPIWAAAAIALYSPLQVIAFPTGNRFLADVAYGLLVIGCSAAAYATLTRRDERQASPAGS
ncbi:MAG: hypothetical protein M3024_02580 [Candidatus Dormibacteraeota bacterium]|nr:hypothetical protein [Candidatus Dormibacteraeota bacterium]